MASKMQKQKICVCQYISVCAHVCEKVTLCVSLCVYGSYGYDSEAVMLSVSRTDVCRKPEQQVPLAVPSALERKARQLDRE